MSDKSDSYWEAGKRRDTIEKERAKGLMLDAVAILRKNKGPMMLTALAYQMGVNPNVLGYVCRKYPRSLPTRLVHVHGLHLAYEVRLAMGLEVAA